MNKSERFHFGRAQAHLQQGNTAHALRHLRMCNTAQVGGYTRFGAMPEDDEDMRKLMLKISEDHGSLLPEGYGPYDHAADYDGSNAIHHGHLLPEGYGYDRDIGGYGYRVATPSSDPTPTRTPLKGTPVIDIRPGEFFPKHLHDPVARDIRRTQLMSSRISTPKLMRTPIQAKVLEKIVADMYPDKMNDWLTFVQAQKELLDAPWAN